MYYRFLNNKSGHQEFINLIKDQDIKLIVCESTGGYEEIICQQLYNNQYSIHKVNTYSFNLFSKSISLCKTDKKDAFKLAYYGEKMQLKANFIYQKQTKTLKRYQQRREDLVLILSNERKRLHHSINGVDKDSIEKYIKFLEGEIADIDSKLDDTIEASADLKKKVDVLKRAMIKFCVWRMELNSN